jgi:protein MAK16
MQCSDEMIWNVINHQFCSFQTTLEKSLSDKTRFCKHPYSVTGLCNRTSCPLANSRYATIREEAGKINLYIKTVERAHSPKNLWERIQLSRNYGKALTQLDEHLEHFPKVLIHRNKQRLTKVHQYLIRMRKLELKVRSGRKAKLVGVHRKIDQREERRERKALVAAKIETALEKELTERLAKGTYGDIYNFPEAPYQKALSKAKEGEEDDEEEDEEETEMDSEDEEDSTMVEYVEDFESDEEEDEEDMEYMGDGKWGRSEDDEDDEDDSSEDDGSDKKKKAKPKRRPRVEIEYERDDEPPVATAEAASW